MTDLLYKDPWKAIAFDITWCLSSAFFKAKYLKIFIITNEEVLLLQRNTTMDFTYGFQFPVQLCVHYFS